MGNERRAIQSLLMLILLALMLLGLPMLGVIAADYPVQRYLEFPPRNLYVTPAPFSWIAFFAYAAFIAAFTAPFAFRLIKSIKAEPARSESGGASRRFPVWGWAAVFAGAAVWLIAWTRMPWFSSIQPHTFTPLWVSFIVAMNALAYRRRGTCLLTHRTGLLLALFPVSAVFWWFFEYLNRFVQNWAYTGAEYGAGNYFLLATLSFSTVLPSVASTWDWVRQWPRLNRGWKDFVSISPERPKRLATAVLFVSAAGLFGIGIWPDYLFALLWTAPLLIIVCLQSLRGDRHVFSHIARGDWRIVGSSALAALLCGFFWELWNYYSLSRWQYRIPFVHRFEIFEMPVLGYAGYLPFGLECMAVVEAVSRWAPGGSLMLEKR